MQSVPQLIPGGVSDEVTVPLPVPARRTVSVGLGAGGALKVAMTVVFLVKAIVQAPVPVQPPPRQPSKTKPLSARAVRVTCVPLSYSAWHVVPQTILAWGVSEEVTVPRAALLPSRTTARVKRVGPAPMTRSVALPVRPPDVAVIVVVPGVRAVATPAAALIVATLGSLLVHVTPSPTTVTGVNAFPSGRLRSCPSPSRPKKPRPQHCTRPPRRSAQVCSAPEVAAVAVVMPVTGAVGGLKMPLSLPLPSWPKLLSPQHSTRPSWRSTQLCSAPGARAAGLVTPLTVTGVEEALLAGGSLPS